MKKQMKRLITFALALILCVTAIPHFAMQADAASAGGPSVVYQSHLAERGWTSAVSNGATSGTTGESRRMEGLKIYLQNVSGGITYRAHVQNIGWMGWTSNGSMAGTEGRSLRMEAIEIKLTGQAAQKYTVQYRVHVQEIGWMDWVSDGMTAGTVGRSLQIEAIQIKLVEKNGSFWQWPMAQQNNGYRLTQNFNSYSSSMAKKGRPYHTGLDMVCSNKQIMAAADGVVTYRGYSNGNGNHIILKHNFNGVEVFTLYSHLANFNGCPAQGQGVSKGTVIGTMGSTGNSTGPHLHFAIYTGNSTDPIGYSSASGANCIRDTARGLTFYNPTYVIQNNRLP